MPDITLSRARAHVSHPDDNGAPDLDTAIGRARSSRDPRRPPQRAAAHRRARALANGRLRARQRLEQRAFTPHPGWRNFIAPGWRVVETQSEALRLLRELAEEEDWRADKREAWLSILDRVAHSMDWTTGLITAVTLTQLGQAGHRASRTVSRVLAWARQRGVLVVVECGASAAFLGTDHGRTPTYALVTNRPLPQPENAEVSAPDPDAGGESGVLPKPLVEKEPLNGRRQPAHKSSPSSWPFFRTPETPAERNAATKCLLQRLGLDQAGVSPVPLWRARALLHRWWEAGVSPAGLVHAIHHHPDQPTVCRGDAFRGAKDQLRVLGHRLAPWQGRLTELPATVVGIRGDYLAAQHVALSERADHAAEERLRASFLPTSSPTARAAARRELLEHLRERGHRRRSRTGPVGRAGS